MFVRRLFVYFSLGLLCSQAVPGQRPTPVPSVPRASMAVTAPTPAPPQITFHSVHIERPYIALTFDDGPNPTLTPKLLDLLAAHHMKATFFVIRQNAVDHLDILRRATRQGHQVAHHSWSHPDFAQMSD